MKLPYDDVHLIADPLYGYLRITLSRSGEIAEPDVIDNPWVQRLKRIHQLQSSWWVFPTAEHSRFAHSLGTMHLAGELARQVYPTLAEVEPGTPSLPLVEETLRMAGLLHDLGHGPFSHFCDEEYLLPVFGIDHEQISQHLIVGELGSLLAELRRSPSGQFAAGEAVDPWHVAFLVRAEEGGARRRGRSRLGAFVGPHPALGPAAPPRALRRGHGRQPRLRAPRRAGCAASASAPSTSTGSSTTPSAPPTASRSTSARSARCAPFSTRASTCTRTSTSTASGTPSTCTCTRSSGPRWS